MTQDQIESLDPMVQFDRVHRVQSGVGLGLAICQLLATRHAGTLSIRPNAQKGLMVEVTLPLASVAGRNGS
jgi:signal transduction histidine kinase